MAQRMRKACSPTPESVTRRRFQKAAFPTKLGGQTKQRLGFLTQRPNGRNGAADNSRSCTRHEKRSRRVACLWTRRMLARPRGQSGRAAGGGRDRAGPEGGFGGAEMEEGAEGGANMGGPSRDGDCLPQTRASRDGRRFLVVDDLLSQLGSPLSIGRGEAPPWESSPQQSQRSAQPSYWPDICDSDFGEFEAKVTEGEEGPVLEWIVDPEGALMVVYLEREAGRASERKAKRVASSIWRAFPETGRVKDGDLRMIAEEDGLVATDKNLAANTMQGSLSPCTVDGGTVHDCAAPLARPTLASIEANANPSFLSLACKKRAPSAPRAFKVELDSLVVTTTVSGRSYVHLGRLFQYIDVDEERAAKTCRNSVMKERNYTYLRLLREHASDVFRDTVNGEATGGMPWLASAPAALLVILLELKNSRASEDRAAGARGMILRTFKGKDLENPNLEKLARDLHVHDSRQRGKAGPRGFIEASSTSDSENEVGDVEDGTSAASSSHAGPLKKRAVSSTAEEGGMSSGHFIVKKLCDQERCVHVSRLYKYISGSVKEPGSKLVFHPKRFAYFRSLQKHCDHVFIRRVQGERGGSELLASAEAALLIIFFELESSRASHTLAERAREEIFRAFEGMGLEDLNLDELVRELEVDDAGKDGTVPHPKPSKPSKYVYDANADNGDNGHPGVTSSSLVASRELAQSMPLPLNAEHAGCFVVKAKGGGQTCVHLTRFLSFLYNRVKPNGKGGGNVQWQPYLRRIQTREVHLFKGMPEGSSGAHSWLASPGAALVVIDLEQQAGRASDERAAKARAEIRRECNWLEGLDLDKLAVELGVGDERMKAKVRKYESTSSESSSSASGDDGGERADSSTMRPRNSSATSSSRPAGRGVIVRTGHAGESIVPLAGLFSHIDKGSILPAASSVVRSRNYPYLVRLRMHRSHIYKEDSTDINGRGPWLASPPAALLILRAELKSNRASRDRAEEARCDILRAFKGKGLEDLNLDELARELGVDSASDDDMRLTCTSSSSESSGSDSEDGLPGSGLKGMPSSSLPSRKQGSKGLLHSGIEPRNLDEELKGELGITEECEEARSRNARSFSGRGGTSKQEEHSNRGSLTTSSHTTKRSKAEGGSHHAVSGVDQAGAGFDAGKPSVTGKRKVKTAAASEDELVESSSSFKKQARSCGRGDREKGAGHSSTDEGVSGSQGRVSPAWSAHSTTAADGPDIDDDEIARLLGEIEAEKLAIERARAEKRRRRLTEDCGQKAEKHG